MKIYKSIAGTLERATDSLTGTISAGLLAGAVIFAPIYFSSSSYASSQIKINKLEKTIHQEQQAQKKPLEKPRLKKSAKELALKESPEIKVVKSNAAQVKDNNLQIPYSDKDVNRLALLIGGEAGICSQEAQIAVAYTVVNRFNAPKRPYGKNLRRITRPSIYNSLNENNENLKEIKKSPVFKEYLEIARGVLSGKLKDPFNGRVIYFHDDSIGCPWNTKKIKYLGKIDKLLFYGINK